jgi:N-methylhydantoinase B
MDGLDNPLSNCANAPVEALETEYPYFRVRTYQLRAGSGGSGQRHGGHGVDRAYEALKDGVIISGYSDRFDAGVRGILGGAPGTPGAFTLHRADGRTENLRSTTSVTLQRGDVFVAHTGGGGGYGESRD